MKKYRPRTYYTEADKAMMWARWAKGESLNSIARLRTRARLNVISHLGSEAYDG